MKVLHDQARRSLGERIVLVMLPGAGDQAADLVRHGFVRALREGGHLVDVMAVDVPFDRYLERRVVSQLERHVIAPARSHGYAQVWFLGISLGALGALSYAKAHGARVAGLVLLAPFLGTRGLVAEVTRAGGLRAWQEAKSDRGDPDRDLLAWLPQFCARESARIYLGYGTEDRYAPASRLLANELPERQVLTMPGGHDRTTWIVLWNRLLAGGGLFARSPSSAQPGGSISRPA